jgi:predicted nucleic acid-binding protein
VAELAAVNTSPLIYLARAKQLHLLRTIVGPEIIVPHSVAIEVRAASPTDPAVWALDSERWLTITPDEPVSSLVAAWDLGPGESAVLSWGTRHPGAELVLDDLAARRCASTLGLPTRGTLGIVLIAKRRGIIPAARPILNQLRQCGMYLADRTLDLALHEVNE